MRKCCVQSSPNLNSSRVFCRMLNARRVAAKLLAFTLLASHSGSAHAGAAARDGAELGHVDFQVSCEGSREDFDRALALMHHMMYAQARSAFEQLAQAEPDCAMAHWGMATTLFQPLWPTRPSEDDLRRGWRQIEQAREIVDSERERRLIDATAAFFRRPEAAEYWPRIERWADGMAAAHQAYPEDSDVAALYGLSRVALAQIAEDAEPLLDEAEAVLQSVFEETPTHPGAIHYSIHATDVEGRAENALDMVRAYGEIAPEVPHALHMPSHIYVRLGDWPKVIAWNQRSAEAAMDYPAGDRVSLHHIHALDYELYALLQQGADDEAQEVLQKALSAAPYQEDFVTAFHLAVMPARVAVEQRDWEKAARIQPNRPDYLSWEQYDWPRALSWFARGMGAVRTGELEEARQAEARMIELREAAKGAGERAFADYIEMDRLILSGRIAWAQEEPDTAVARTQEAADIEQTVEKQPVTPGALLPPNEALGDLHMALGRPDEALRAYEASDAIWPGRYNTLLGAARAAKAAGEETAAKRHYRNLLANTRDSARPGLEEARQFVD